MEHSELLPPTPLLPVEGACPHCFGRGTVVASSDIEVILVCDACGREWTAEREHPLTPYNPRD